jgi:hypothetical protein
LHPRWRRMPASLALTCKAYADVSLKKIGQTFQAAKFPQII